MARKARLRSGEVEVGILLLDTPTARALWEALPFSSTACRWGKEVYFRTPLALEEEPTAREVVDVGEVGYWPPGQALCLFFGPTPISRGQEIRAASPVNIVGQVEGEVALLERIREGDPVAVERWEE